MSLSPAFFFFFFLPIKEKTVSAGAHRPVQGGAALPSPMQSEAGGRGDGVLVLSLRDPLAGPGLSRGGAGKLTHRPTPPT